MNVGSSLAIADLWVDSVAWASSSSPSDTKLVLSWWFNAPRCSSCSSSSHVWLDTASQEYPEAPRNRSRAGSSMLKLMMFSPSMNPLTARELLVEDCKWLYTPCFDQCMAGIQGALKDDLLSDILTNNRESSFKLLVLLLKVTLDGPTCC